MDSISIHSKKIGEKMIIQCSKCKKKKDASFDKHGWRLDSDICFDCIKIVDYRYERAFRRFQK